MDEVLGDRQQPTMADYTKLKYVMRCVNESMRLYPHPPVLLRRAMIQDELPGKEIDSCKALPFLAKLARVPCPAQPRPTPARPAPPRAALPCPALLRALHTCRWLHCASRTGRHDLSLQHTPQPSSMG